jgi:CRP-like cAMP-binding protein
VVLRGEIEILFTAGGGGLVSLEWAGAGQVLGIRAFIPPYRYLSTARCLTGGCFLAIDALELRSLIEEDSQLGVSIHECLMVAILNRVPNVRTMI